MIIGANDLPRDNRVLSGNVFFKVLVGGAVEAWVLRLPYNLARKGEQAPDNAKSSLAWVDLGSVPPEEFILWDGEDLPDPNAIPGSEIYDFTSTPEPADYPTLTDALADLFSQWSGLGDIYVAAPKPDPYKVDISTTDFDGSIIQANASGSVRAGSPIDFDPAYRFLYEIFAGSPFGANDKIVTIRGRGGSDLTGFTWTNSIAIPDRPALETALNATGDGNEWDGDFGSFLTELANLGYNSFPDGWYINARVRLDASPEFGFDDFFILQ